MNQVLSHYMNTSGTFWDTLVTFCLTECPVTP